MKLRVTLRLDFFLRSIIALAWISGFALPTSARDSAVADYAGIYVAPTPLLNAKRSLRDEVYSSGAASGVYVRLVWSQVEPRPGQYDFTLLDRELDRAIAARRRVSLSVIAGGHAPKWLSEAGIKTAKFDVPRGGANRSCASIEMGVPWDPAYQRAYMALWKAIADHIKRKPGGFDAIRIVKLTGVNRITEELRLPGTFGNAEDVCGRTDDAKLWLAAGYRPQLVVEAWAAMAQGIADAFPGKHLGLDILERNDFPPIDDNGAFVRDAPVKARIIAEGLRRFPGRLSVQWNGLNAGGPIAETVLQAGRNGAAIGWQSNAFRGFDGAGCNAQRMATPQPCDAAGFAAILKRGIDAGGTFIEVWEPDALRFAPAVKDADAAMRARSDKRQ